MREPAAMADAYAVDERTSANGADYCVDKLSRLIQDDLGCLCELGVSGGNPRLS